MSYSKDRPSQARVSFDTWSEATHEIFALWSFKAAIPSCRDRAPPLGLAPSYSPEEMPPKGDSSKHEDDVFCATSMAHNVGMANQFCQEVSSMEIPWNRLRVCTSDVLSEALLGLAVIPWKEPKAGDSALRP